MISSDFFYLHARYIYKVGLILKIWKNKKKQHKKMLLLWNFHWKISSLRSVIEKLARAPSQNNDFCVLRRFPSRYMLNPNPRIFKISWIFVNNNVRTFKMISTTISLIFLFFKRFDHDFKRFFYLHARYILYKK